MAIPQATRDLIIAMAEDPAGPSSVREIARETGISRNTVTKILRESVAQDGGSIPQEVAQNPTSPARTIEKPAKTEPPKKVAQKIEPPLRPPTHVQVMQFVEITRDQTLKDAFDLLQIAKKNLANAVRQDDGSPQSRNAVNGATRAVTEILRELGKWCGLQDSIAQRTTEQRPASELSLDECMAILQGKP